MTNSSTARRAAFRAKVNERQGLLVPGAFNAMSARVIEDAGFEALYLTGAGVTNMSLGLPDLGFIGLHEIAEHTARVRDAVALPLIVDADTGFGMRSMCATRYARWSAAARMRSSLKTR